MLREEPLELAVKRSPLSQLKRRLWKVSSVAAARSRWTTFTCACKLLDSGVYRPLREPRECHRIASSHVATDSTRQGTRNYLLRFLYTKQFCDSIISSLLSARIIFLVMLYIFDSFIFVHLAYITSER